MKKNFFGMAGVLAAFAFGAFTIKPTSTQSFFFDSCSFSFTRANVENPDNWIAGSLTCTTGARAACVIDSVSAKYYHFEDTELVLNSYSRPSTELGDLQYSITATEGNTHYVFIVNILPPFGGIINNKQ